MMVVLVLDPQAAGAFFCRATMRRPRGVVESESHCCGPRTLISNGSSTHFYGALSEAASTISLQPASDRMARRCAAHHRQLLVWAANYPENFEDRAALVAPRSPDWKAASSMPSASTNRPSARPAHNGFVHNEALAHELAARFYAARGFQNDRACVSPGRPLRLSALGRRWEGAATRSALSASERERAGTRANERDRSAGRAAGHRAVVKVSQAVSGEIVLDRLIQTLMTIAVEHAGAERGLLILLRGDTLQIEAEARTDQQDGRGHAASRRR